MHRLERALGILLLLRSGNTVSAAELARRFEVSPRTIYRDVELLSAIGVPVYAEMGRNGGFRLVEGYFLPPIMFSHNEATALLVGVAMLQRLRATPFAADLATAAQKVVAALPDAVRDAMTRAEHAIGFEALPNDLLHPERSEPGAPRLPEPDAIRHEQIVLSAFLQAIVAAHAVALSYVAPGRTDPVESVVVPRGLIWDRDRWYLVSGQVDAPARTRLWRADRVTTITLHDPLPRDLPAFDPTALLGRRWLEAAMHQWATEAPVVLSLTALQAAQLQADWYYRHARFEPQPDGRVIFTYGEDDQAVVFALLRWLGPGARLLTPASWLPAWHEQLQLMLAEAGNESAPQLSLG